MAYIVKQFDLSRNQPAPKPVPITAYVIPYMDKVFGGNAMLKVNTNGNKNR